MYETPLSRAARLGGTWALSVMGDDAQSATAAETVAATIDVVLLATACLIGVGIGFVVATIVMALARRVTRRQVVLAALFKRIRTPMYVAFMVWGGWGGLGTALLNIDLAEWQNGALVQLALHAILVVGILTATWIAYSAAWIFEDAARLRRSSDHGRARRFETQAQIARRLAQVVVVILGVSAALLTFEAARAAMTTVLASAGLISVVAGLAAKETLGNVFAGLQLAFTDAIRVGDVVVLGTGSESGAVEEVTLGYVVVRVWDERRYIVPSTFFTSNTFQNWTRRAATQMGTVELKLDWAAPMALIREKVEQLLRATDLWDGRSWNVQMTDSDATTVTVRIAVSAENSGRLSDLRCYLREQLIHWIVTDEPWARPAQRTQSVESVEVPHDTSREQVARLAKELAGISGAVVDAGSASPIDEATDPAQLPADSSLDPVHAARLMAARRRSKRERRKAMAQRQRELANGSVVLPDASAAKANAGAQLAPTSEQGTEVLSATTVLRVLGKGERLFSGSPDADERAEMWKGPGQEALDEREEAIRRRDTREQPAVRP